MMYRTAPLSVVLREARWIQCGIVGIWMAVAGPVGTAAEVRIRFDAISVYPADIAIRQGDTVTWIADDGFAGSVEDFEGGFESAPIIGGVSDSNAYSRTYGEPGMFAFSRVRRSTSPPYPKSGTAIPSQGTITAIPQEEINTTVELVAPVAGAVFAALPPNQKGARFPSIILQAGVAESNEVARVEFYASGVQVGSAEYWPYEVLWNAGVLGRFDMTATVVRRAGDRATSRPVEIAIEEMATATWCGARVVRPGFTIFEYSVPPPAPWEVVSASDVGNLGISFKAERRITSNWGRFVKKEVEPTQFFGMRVRN